MLVKGSEILKAAQKGKYAVPAFNINNLEVLQAVLKAAVELKAPIFISTSEGAIKYAGLDYLGAMMQVAQAQNIPLAFHLDHGQDEKLIKAAVQSGYYSSLMIDGSALPYQKNVALTKLVATFAHKHKISVEAELGALKGIEDLVKIGKQDAYLTHPKLAQDFVAKTKCDSLGVAIGTSHGAFKFTRRPKLDLVRLLKIRQLVRVPLVLHGASAVPPAYVQIANKYGARIKGAQGNADSEILQAIRLGICKINIDTDLRIAFTAGVRRHFAIHPQDFDLRDYLGAGSDYIYRVAKHKIKLFGCAGKA